MQYQPKYCFIGDEYEKEKWKGLWRIVNLIWFMCVGDYKKIKGLCESHDIVMESITSSGRPVYSDKEIDEDLTRLVGKDGGIKSGLVLDQHRGVGACALNGLLEGLAVMSDTNELEKYVLVDRDIQAYMQMDGNAMRAMNVFDEGKVMVNGFQQITSLYKVLNHGKTKMGDRLLHVWLRMPLVKDVEIRKRQDLVGFFVDRGILRSELLDEGMKGIPDIGKLAYKLDHGKSKVQLVDLVLIYDTMKDVVPRMCCTLQNELEKKNGADALKGFEQELSGCVVNMMGYIELMEELVDMDARPTLMVNAKHDQELQVLKEQLCDMEEQIEQEFQHIQQLIGDDIKCEKDKVRGFVFRMINKKGEGRLSKSTNITICQVLTNGIHFTTKNLKTYAKKHKEIMRDYDVRQQHLLKAAVDVAASYVPVLEAASTIIAELDVLLGFAHVASHAGDGYVRPEMSSDRDIHITQARHPCLELHDDMSFIPNNYEFIQKSSRFQIITGPNMGGKSTYIRQLGMFAIMHQIGSFVPASSATLPIFDRLLARVGANDSQQKGVSTFMAEMLEASIILDRATSNSLVIIDELGRGTSTFDGFGLAYAISRDLLSRVKCTCMFATHFHELTTLQHEAEGGATNKHVTAKVLNNQLVMVYEIQNGPCMESFGIHVATLTRFPQRVIQNAKRKAAELEKFNQPISTNKENTHTLLNEFASLPLSKVLDTNTENQLTKLLSK